MKWYLPASQRLGRLTIIDPQNLADVQLGKATKLLPIVIEFDLMWVDVDPKNGNRYRGPEFIDTENISAVNKVGLRRGYWGPDIAKAAKVLEQWFEDNKQEYGWTTEKPVRQRQIVVSDEEAEEFRKFQESKGRPVSVSDEDLNAVGSAYIGAKPKQGPRKVGG